MNKLRGFEYTNFGTVRPCVSYEEKELRILMLRGFVSAASKGVKVTRFSLRVFVWICEKPRQEAFHGFIRWCRRPLATKLCQKKIKISKN